MMALSITTFSITSQHNDIQHRSKYNVTFSIELIKRGTRHYDSISPLCHGLNVVILSATNKPFTLSVGTLNVVKLSVIMLSVVAKH